jgi:integrase
MTNALARSETVALEYLRILSETAQTYASAAKAANTILAYKSDWKHFEAWCLEYGCESLPASGDTVALYLADLARQGKRPATIARRVASISQAHKTRNLPTPTGAAEVRVVLAGVRRTHGTAQRQVAPALVDEIRQMAHATPATLLGTRDRALLLLGFAGAFRRSELVSLNVSDLDFRRSGLVVTIRKSKTDQDGRGRRVGIPYGSSPETCPVRTLQSWLSVAKITRGAVFRGVDRGDKLCSDRLSDRGVARAVKRAAKALGLDAARYSGHSLRAGLATSAAAAGASDRAIMRQTGHRSSAMVGRYVREGRLFANNAAALVGL